MQSDDGRVGHHAAAASWSLAEQSVLTGGEMAGDWDQLSIVVVVGIAVVLATVVVAVSALILHTQRRLHGGVAATQPDRNGSTRGATASLRRNDVEQVSRFLKPATPSLSTVFYASTLLESSVTNCNGVDLLLIWVGDKS